MRWWNRVVSIVALCLLSSCGGSSPAAPSRMGYEGRWSGSMIPLGSVAFTVSAEQRVTSLTVNLGGCSRTFTGLALVIAPPMRAPGSPTGGPFDNPGFGYASGDPEGAEFINVSGAFTSSETATGIAVSAGSAGCGDSLGAWNATRR